MDPTPQLAIPQLASGVTARQFYLDRIAQARGRLDGPDWLTGLRDDGAAAFSALGFPTRKTEDWKYTSLGALENVAFTDRVADPGTRGAEGLSEKGPGPRLVFVGGRFRADLSDAGPDTKGVQVAPLSRLLEGGADWLQDALGQGGAGEGMALLALNAALMEDGFAIRLEPGTQLAHMIELVFIADGDSVAYHPRNLILAGPGANATLLETHLGADGTYFANGATEIIVDAGASVAHYKLQDESADAIHTSTTLVRIAPGGSYRSLVMSTGAKLSRNEIRADLEGEGAEVRLDGVYLGRGEQHMDHTTVVRHLSPGAVSQETYIGALADKARAVFQGNIRVERDAQKSDGQMRNRTLLLSDEAEIDSKPQLEIYADDVKCSHGTTVGELDEDALFYLRSRAIPEPQARAMLVEAFLAEVIDDIAIDGVCERLRTRLSQWLENAGGKGQP